MKRNSIIRIIIYSLVILILSSVLIGFLTFDRLSLITVSSNSNITGDVNTGAASLSPTGITKMDILWISGSVDIRYDDVDSIVLEESPADTAHPMVWGHDNDTLTICYSQEFNGNIRLGIDGSKYQKKDLIVTLPRDFSLASLEMETISADVTAAGLVARELDWQTVSGTGVFTGCTAENVDLEAVSGSLEYSGSLQALDVEAVSGNCTIRLYNSPRKIDMDTVSGDVVLYLPEACGFTVSTDSLQSNLKTEFTTQVVDKRHIHGDGSCKIDMDGLSGKLSIYKNPEA